MKFFFDPEGVVVIGATPNPLKGGNAIVKNLEHGYTGNIYPVNPRYTEIDGLACYPTVEAVPGKADLAIIFVPAAQVPEALKKCAVKGISGAMIESGGFAETGPAGEKLQAEIAEIAARTGIRVWGPNCMGLVDITNKRFFTFMIPDWQKEGILFPGRVSLIVQSGMLSAVFLVDLMTNALTGISKVCSMGNKVDVNGCDVFEYLADDPETDVIGMYLESLDDGKRFIETCRRCKKPIVLLKGGRTGKGAEAAMSHTASLAGNQRIVSGAMAQMGVIEVKDFRQMADICRTLAMTKPSEGGQRVAVLTFSGGAGIVSTDFIEEKGLKIADFKQETKKDLEKLFPSWMPVSNPVDLWPAIESHIGSSVDVQGIALSTVLADPGVDGVFLHLSAGNPRMFPKLDLFAERIREHAKPVVTWQIGRQDLALALQKDALSAGIPLFTEIGRAVEALAAAMKKRRDTEPAPKTSPLTLPPAIERIVTSQKGPLDEHLSKEFLNACGIPTVEEAIVSSAKQAQETAIKFGYPVVMKGLLPGAVHKSEMSLVHLALSDELAVARSFTELTAQMENRGQVLLQKQIPGKAELILGLVRDPQFGPCVMFGLGGIYAELFEDIVFGVAPLTLKESLGMIDRINAQKILNGFRSEPPVDREAIAKMIVRMGEIGITFPQIKEIDINPLICFQKGAVAVDATTILSETNPG